jgi:hypothetical protein
VDCFGRAIALGGLDELEPGGGSTGTHVGEGGRDSWHRVCWGEGQEGFKAVIVKIFHLIDYTMLGWAEEGGSGIGEEELVVFGCLSQAFLHQEDGSSSAEEHASIFTEVKTFEGRPNRPVPKIARFGGERALQREPLYHSVMPVDVEEVTPRAVYGRELKHMGVLVGGL